MCPHNKDETIFPVKRIYYPEIDGIRFFAFLLVFMHHFVPNSNLLIYRIQAYGWIGVDLFFVLSAFLLTKLMVKEWEKSNSINFKFFYIRRILRIWPLYFAYIAYIIVSYFLLFKSQDTLAAFTRIIGMLTFTDNIFTMSAGFNHVPGTAHLWTISFEEQFYIFLPLMLPFLIKNKTITKYILLCLFILIFLLRYLLEDYPYPYVFASPLHLDSFLAGIVLGIGIADNVLKLIPKIIKGLIGFGSIVFVMFLPNPPDIGASNIFIYLIIALGFFFLIELITSSDNVIINLLFRSAQIRYLGKISYGLYIFHILAIAYTSIIFQKLNIVPNWYLLFFASLMSTVLISIVSYELYEKFFLKLKEKYAIIKSRPA